MKTIHKYEIKKESAGVFEMPRGARVIHTDNQPYQGLDGHYDRLMLWAEVDTDRQTEHRRWKVIATGQERPGDDYEHVGTALFTGGAYVWHIYLEPSRGG